MEKFLIVDLDKSLLKIDLFKELLGKSLLNKPWLFCKTAFMAITSRAKAKIFISKEFKIEWHTLPFDNRVINIIANYREKGYQIILATGAPDCYARPIANYLGLFDKVIATDIDINNVGGNKLEAIKNEVGDDFIYLGDSVKDLPIWLYCKKSILVRDNINIKKKLEKNSVEIIDIVKREKSILGVLLKQIRVHQWTKNLLLFVPALASHQIMMPEIFINALKSFIAFSMLASSVYVFNDIVDVDHDRKHPKNKSRPIANGNLSIFSAYSILLVCFLIGGWLALGLGTPFIILTTIYIVLNLLYSFYLKKVIILDVILIMSFYTLRLIAGHVPNEILLSPWMLSFSIFLFFSLGLLKRYVDTIIMHENNEPFLSGRSYSINDSNMLMTLGTGSGLVSALVLILYTGSDQIQQFYTTPMVLVALAPVMLYWISRLWLMAERGMIKSDPVLYVVKDKISYLTFLIVLILLFAAS